MQKFLNLFRSEKNLAAKRERFPECKRELEELRGYIRSRLSDPELTEKERGELSKKMCNCLDLYSEARKLKSILK